MKKENLIKEDRKGIFALFAVIALILLCCLLLVGSNETQIDDASSIRLEVKSAELLVNKKDSVSKRAISYARNIIVVREDSNGMTTAKINTLGNGSLIIGNNNAVYQEADRVYYISNLGIGTVEITVEMGDKTASASFTVTDGTSKENPEGLNIVDLPSYARPDSERDIMDSEKGYHEHVYDENNNIIGTVGRDEILGTNEADKVIESLPNVSVGEVAGNQFIDSKPTPKPETQTPPVVEENKDEVVAPEVTPEPTPEVTPEVTPTPTPTPTPEPAPEVITPEENGQGENGAQISNAYDRIVILTDGDPIVFFGNGTETLVIEDASSFNYTDNGDGTITCEYGIFNK